MKKRTAVVIGAGPIGSMVSIKLAQQGFRVDVYNDENDSLNAKGKGTGIVENNEVPGSDSGLLTDQDMYKAYLETDAYFRGLSQEKRGPWSNLVTLRNVTYLYSDPNKNTDFLNTYAPGCNPKRLERKDLSPHHQEMGLQVGASFFAPILDLPNIMTEFRYQAMKLGVVFHDERVTDFDRFNDTADVVIEATGVGRKIDQGDDSIRPRRGQSLVFEGNHGLKEVIGMPGDNISVNVVPQNSRRIIVGATKEFDSLDVNVSEATRKELMTVGTRLFPGLAKMNAVGDPIGFRPTRQKLLFEIADNKICVNGLGGGGWSVSESLSKTICRSALEIAS